MKQCFVLLVFKFFILFSVVVLVQVCVFISAHMHYRNYYKNCLTGQLVLLQVQIKPRHVFLPPAASREVFVSYKWHIQNTVRSLVTKLEDKGYPCWMDTDQMGGGDRMNTKIDAAIRASKVISYKALNKSLSFSLQGNRLQTLWCHW